MNLSRPRILEFVSKQRIPLVTGWGPWVQVGGLLSYGPDLDVLVKRAAAHVDRILKGSRPSELPVEQPTKFDLVINQDREGARPDDSAVGPGASGHSDRVARADLRTAASLLGLLLRLLLLASVRRALARALRGLALSALGPAALLLTLRAPVA